MWRIDNGGCQDGNLKPGKVDDKPPFVVEMSGILFIMNYRKLYESHYGISIPSDFHIHHMDRNRKNNAISNLLLLPGDIHSKLHFSGMVIEQALMSGKGPFSIKNGPHLRYISSFIELYASIIQSICFWVSAKECEDMHIGGFGEYSYNCFRKCNTQ